MRSSSHFVDLHGECLLFWRPLTSESKLGRETACTSTPSASGLELISVSRFSGRRPWPAASFRDWRSQPIKTIPASFWTAAQRRSCFFGGVDKQSELSRPLFFYTPVSGPPTFPLHLPSLLRKPNITGFPPVFEQI